MTFYRVEPLAEVWENPTPVDERRSRWTFKATWSATLDLLEREIRLLDPHRSWEETGVIMQVACRPGDVRRDGGIRADARAFDHPGVRVSFTTARHGALSYGTDVCDYWQHNVRSIALGLEALRAVDRYGISTGQQYVGFKALPAGRAMPASHMTSDEAWSILGSFSDVPVAQARQGDARPLLRKAQAFAHPDRHSGDRELWDQVEQAGKVLGLIS